MHRIYGLINGVVWRVGLVDGDTLSQLWNYHVGIALFALQPVGKRVGGFFFAVNNEGVLRPFVKMTSPFQEFFSVSMGAEAVYRDHIGLQMVLFAKDFDLWYTVYDAAA